MNRADLGFGPSRPTTKPTTKLGPTPTIDVASIPAELKALPQWVVWREVVRHDRPTKVPYQSLLIDTEARTDDAATWSSFEEAVGAALDARGQLSGIGLVFSPDDGYCGIDFDNCLDGSGGLLDWARPYIERIPAYAEISPSGRGVKLFCRGSVPGGKGRKKQKLGPDGDGAIEIYDRLRYFTTTGLVFEGRRRIGDGAMALAALHAELFPPAPAAKRPRIAPGPAFLDDAEILDRARASKDGARFLALFSGSTDGYPSKSEADLALCSKLAFWVGGDVEAIDRLFRHSGLSDTKWAERPDYREATITRAVNRTTFYDPNFKRPAGDDGGKGPGGVVAGPDDEPRPEEDGFREGIEDPHRLARIYLAGRHAHPDGPTLRYWREEWHRWDGRAWRVTADREVAAEVTGTVKEEFDRWARERSKQARPVTTRMISNVTQALRHLALLPTREVARQPEWLGPFEPGEDLPEPRDVLPASNALVHLPSFAAGDPCSLAPTPRFFGPNSLGYEFDPSAARPAAWLEFLRDLWPDDPEAIESLQEWFGYLLTPDTSQQKILMIIGPKRSGKGTIGRILRALVGLDNVTAPTLSGLATNFGLAPLIGKPVALISDARLSGRADTQVIVERLLSISGEDAQTIDRKHLSSWTGSLSTRFILISNELPRLGDSSGALPSRMILLPLTRSFFGQEDTSLTGRLLMERPSILLWAIEGWARLHRRGRFDQPRSGRELLDDLDDLASPVGTFVTAECDVGPNLEVDVQVLFAAWKKWCELNGRDHPGDVAGLGRNLRAHLPGLKTKQVRRDGKHSRIFLGLEIRPSIPAF